MADVERSGLEKIILAGIGAVTKTAETANELLEELVKKGELTIEQGKALNEELKHNIKSSVNEAKQSAKSSAVNVFVDGMDKLSPDDIEKIKEKLAQMDRPEDDRLQYDQPGKDQSCCAEGE